MFKLKRHELNPIFKPDPNIPWEAEGVFNPGVVKVGDEVVMLYRAVGERDAYISHLGLAKSKDGVTFERFIKNSDMDDSVSLPQVPKLKACMPVFGPSHGFDTWATEDPRITKIGDDFYITYVAVPERIMDHDKGIDRVLPLETATALLKTKDFVTFENLGVISPPRSDNKDIVIFPKKVPVNTKVAHRPEPMSDMSKVVELSHSQHDHPKMRYAMLHRPNRWNKDWFDGQYAEHIQVPLPCPVEELPSLPSIWIAWSDDLIYWDDHQMLLSPSHASDAKIGPGLPPIETPDGWLMIYHHVEKGPRQYEYIYSIRIALLDLKDPTQVIGKLPYDVLVPETDYEQPRDMAHIVFPTGGFIDGDTLYIYYGAGDTTIGLATGSVSELMAELKTAGTAGKSKHETA